MSRPASKAFLKALGKTRQEKREAEPQTCPHCGGAIHESRDILTCPRCGRRGCCPEDGSGCMPGGRGCICPECEENTDG